MYEEKDFSICHKFKSVSANTFFLGRNLELDSKNLGKLNWLFWFVLVLKNIEMAYGLKTIISVGFLVIRKIENSNKCWIFKIYEEIKKKTREISQKSKVDT